MPDGELEKKEIHPPPDPSQPLDSVPNEAVIDSIPEQEFESESPQLGKWASTRQNILEGSQASTQLPTEPPEPSQPGLPSDTSTKLLALFQRTKTGSAEVDDPEPEYPEPEYPQTEYPDSEPVEAVPSAAPEPAVWTLPESKLTQQERKIKKEYLTKEEGTKSPPMRPTEARKGTGKSDHWILRDKLKLATLATICLGFFVWLVGHSLVAQQLVKTGTEQLSDGHPDDALNSFNRAIQVDGANASAYFNRGNAYRKKGEFKKSYDDYSLSLKLSPKSVNVLDSRATLSLQLENYQLAAEDYTLIFGIAPEEKQPQMYHNRADAYVGLGQYDKALQDYGVALKVNPKDIKALTSSASCLLQLGRYGKAISEYNLVLALDPHNSDGYLGRGYCYQKQKNFTQAAKDFQTVLTQSPRNKEALCYRARLYADQGLLSKAFEDLAVVLQLDPSYERALIMAAVLYTSKGDYAQAVKDYNQAQKVAHFKETLTLCLARASVYGKMKEYEKAAADYTTAIGLAPNDYRPYLSRAQCYQQLKDFKKAIADCSTAAKLSPKTSNIYQQRGTIHEQFGNPISAFKDYTTAISLDKKNIESYISRGRFSLAKQDFAAALTDFDQALKIDSNNDAALAGRKQTLASTPRARLAPAYGKPANLEVPAASPDFSKVSSADLIKNGYDRMKQGSTEESIAMLCEAVKRNPNDTTARRYLGYALLSAKRRSEAVEQFEALRKLGDLLPSDERAIQQATPVKNAHKPTTPMGEYQARIASDPKDLNARYELTLEYIKLGQTDDAINECVAGMSQATKNTADEARFSNLLRQLQATKK